jgi:hypothetical protein
VPTVFFGNGVEGKVNFILVCLLGPFLCNIGASHVDGFSFLWLPYLFNRLSLHEEDSFSHMQVATALELYRFSLNLPCFPIDFGVEVVEEGVAQDDVVFS